MSGYKTFGIWGAGNLGGRIAVQLMLRKASVIILTRAESVDSEANKILAVQGAQIRSFDVNSPDASSGLQDIDVLISTTGFGGLALQTKLVEAAHKAEVKLFVPAEFGDTSDGRSEPIFQLKQKIRADSAQLGLPTVAFFTGLWIEWVLNLGFDLKNHKVVINGEGNSEISATSIEDIARFVAYVLTSLPREKLENVKFVLEGDKIILNELAASLNKLSSKPLEISHIPRSILEAKLETNPDATTSLLLGWDTGKGKHPTPVSNEAYPDWNPKKSLDVLKGYVS